MPGQILNIKILYQVTIIIHGDSQRKFNVFRTSTIVTITQNIFVEIYQDQKVLINYPQIAIRYDSNIHQKSLEYIKMFKISVE